MTIMKSEQLKHGQLEKRCRNFHKNFDLNVTAQDPEQEPDLQCELIENHYSSELSGTTEKHVHNHSMVMEIGKHEEPVLQVLTKNFEGCADELSVLAAQSEDSVAVTHTNNQNQDQECSQELLDGLQSVSRVSSEKRALCCEVTGTRLTQIRKQARCKYLSTDQNRYEDNQCKHLQRKTNPPEPNKASS
ncbi:hypothetical protein P8452_47545 [Trifolium repens]|nr:hypothetical protein P8452_47545 [Trifolium repens]